MAVNAAPLWTSQDLAAALGARPVADVVVTGVSIDSRTVSAGDLFIALIGETGDGHRFVVDALTKGAAAALVHADVPGADPARLVRVNDTFAGLQALGRYARARSGAKVVAVTGSVGKTSTKEILRTVLSANGTVHAAEASYNNHWGVPLTLARMPQRSDFAVIEIGMNHVGEIAPLAQLARPHVAVITTVEKVHLGYLGSLQAIADEKAAIFQGVEPDGCAVLPCDSEMFSRLRAALAARPDIRVLGFGRDAGAEARLLDVKLDADGSTVAVRLSGQDISFRLALPGAHMAMNALAALAAVRALGADVGRGAENLARMGQLAGRGLRRDVLVAGGKVVLLDESYNASAASVRAALTVLKSQNAARRIAVLGDMRELGEFGPAEHAGLADAVENCADLLFACGPLMRHLYEAVPERMRAVHVETSQMLAPIVKAALRAGDAVLVKGSLGTKMKPIVDAIAAGAGRDAV